MKRRLFVPALALLLLGLWVLSRLHTPVSPTYGDPASIPLPGSPFTHVWTTRPVLLVGIGDSVTKGFGASLGKSYFDRLQMALRPVLPNLKALNLAISGSTSVQHLALEIPKLEPQPAGVLGLVVMTSGGNDLIHDYGRTPPREDAMYGASLEQAKPWVDAYQRRLGSMLDRIQAAFPGGCHIFLADVYDPTDGVGDLERAGLPVWKDGPAILQACNQSIAQAVAGRHDVHLVHIREAFRGHGIHCTWSADYHDHPEHWYSSNFEDPNDRGYDALGRLFLREIVTALAPPA